ncbi:MAG: glycosyltransferase family 39 protein [Anaerolineae bacterium]
MAERVPSRDRWLLLGLTVFGMAARLGLAALPRVIRWDEPDYLWLGRSLFSGRGYTIGPYPDLHYTPLLPILAGPLTRLLPNLEWATAFWYVVCGSLWLWPVYGLARQVYGARVALGAAVLAAAFPALTISPLYWGTMTEPPYLLLLFCGLYTAYRAWWGGRLRFHAAAGAALALAYLTRPEGVLYFGLVALPFLATAIVEGRWRTGTWWRGFATFVLAWLLVAGPYLAYLRLQSGRWLVTGKVGVTLALGEGVVDRDPAAYDRAIASLDDAGREIVWFSPQRFQEPGLLDQLRAQPMGVARRVAHNLLVWYGVFFSRLMFPLPLGMLAVLGLFATPWTRRQARGNLFLGAMLAPPFAFLTLHVEARFFAPLAPLLLIWTAAGVEALGRWLAGSWQSLWHGHPVPEQGSRYKRDLLVSACRGLPWGMVVLYLGLLWPGTLQAGRASLDFGHKAMGLWLRDHTPPGAVVMARDLAVPLYGERGYAPAPHATYEALHRYAQAHGATFWATDAYELTVVKPHLAFLLDSQQRPPNLEAVYAQESRNGLNLVFRFSDAAGGEQ